MPVDVKKTQKKRKKKNRVETYKKGKCGEMKGHDPQGLRPLARENWN